MQRECFISHNPLTYAAQSAGAVEYTDCISAKRQDSPNECPGNDTKQSDDEELWGHAQYPFIAITLRSTLVAPDRVLSLVPQNYLIFKLCIYAKLNCLT